MSPQSVSRIANTSMIVLMEVIVLSASLAWLAGCIGIIKLCYPAITPVKCFGLLGATLSLGVSVVILLFGVKMISHIRSYVAALGK
jgi:uncharacterized membrane protein